MQKLLYILPLICIMYSCKWYYDDKPVIPAARNGVIDLINWDFKKNGPVKLNGEWDFYWNKLIFPGEENQNIANNIKFPGIWNGYVHNDTLLKGDGYATYKLKIKISTQYKEFALKTYTFATAAKIFINGTEVASVGEVGITRYASKPVSKPVLINFTADSDLVEILIQISNFHHR